MTVTVITRRGKRGYNIKFLNKNDAKFIILKNNR